jgi:hypothetical protein
VILIRAFLNLALILTFSSFAWADDETPQEFFFAFDTGFVSGHNLDPQGREPLAHFAAVNDRACLSHLLKQLTSFIRKPESQKKIENLSMLGGRFEAEVKVGIRLICAGAKAAPKPLIQISQKSKLPSREELTCEHFILEPVVVMRNDDGIDGVSRLYQIEHSAGLLRLTNKQSKAILTTNLKNLADLDPFGKRSCASELSAQDMNFVLDEAKAELSARTPTPRPEGKPEVEKQEILPQMLMNRPKIHSI